MIIETRSPEMTYRLGEAIGRQVKPGDIICLNGDLGVGKTVFTQGLALGLGIDEPVCSPTFTIIQEYDTGRIPLYHSMYTVYQVRGIWTNSAMKNILRGWRMPYRMGQTYRGIASG